MNQLTRTLVVLSLALAATLNSTGCRSMGEPASASFASVTIKGKTTEQIRDMTAAVFRESGYAGYAPDQHQMVFNKEGSRMNTLSRDGIIGAQAGATTLIRVKAELVYLDSDSQRLQCQAYMVSGAGDAFFEEEQRLANFRSGPYQKLLDEVAQRLK